MAMASLQMTNLHIRGPASVTMPWWDDVNDELLLAVHGSNAEFQFDGLQVVFFLAFGEIDLIQGKDALSVLSAMAGEVERIILATEAESLRLGLIT